MSQSKKSPISWVMFLHFLLVLGTATGFGVWGWQHHPIREWVARKEPDTQPPPRIARGKPLKPQYLSNAPKALPGILGQSRLGGMEKVMVTFRLLWADLLIFLTGIFFYYIGTRTYFRIFENWMAARTSGDVQAIRGRGLQDQALSENIGRGESR